MNSKLTLSLPAKTISEAKQIAKRRHTTVSALFAESLRQWRFGTETVSGSPSVAPRDMTDLLGVLSPQAPFDARSEKIRNKHA